MTDTGFLTTVHQLPMLFNIIHVLYIDNSRFCNIHKCETGNTDAHYRCSLQ